MQADEVAGKDKEKASNVDAQGEANVDAAGLVEAIEHGKELADEIPAQGELDHGGQGGT